MAVSLAETTAASLAGSRVEMKAVWMAVSLAEMMAVH